MTGMPRLFKSFFGPIPDSWRIWGVWTPPPVTITSFDAFTVLLVPPAEGRYSTPTAWCPLKRTFDTVVSARR